LSSPPEEYVFAVHDGVELKGDLYRPSGNGPFPGLILVYGGGWSKGQKERWRDWGAHLARLGIASFATTYRLSKPGRPTYPQSVWDVKSAIQFVKSKSIEFGIDSKRLGGMGTSAGAHLLSLMTLTGDDPVFKSPYTEEAWYGNSAKLDVAIVMCGIYDMISQWEHDQLTRPLDHITERYMGGTPMSIREKFYQASPLYHASSQNAAGTKWLIAWGTADSVVDYKTQALPFLTALTRAGAIARSVELVGAEHFWTMEPLDSDVHCRTFTGRLPQFFTNCGWGLDTL